MDKYVTIKGVKYKLTPVKKSLVEQYSGVAELVKHLPVKEENAGSNPVPRAEVKDAVPKVSDYRERFKKRQIRPDEVIVKAKFRTNLNDANTKPEFRVGGENMFFGSGVEQET